MTVRLSESDRQAVAAVARIICDGDNFLITTHSTMDGDSVASELALLLRLRRMGKRVVVVNQDPVPRVYQFLPGSGEIQTCDRLGDLTCTAVFVLDCGNLARTGRVKNLLPDCCCIVNIDHHLHNTRYGRINWVGPSYAACGEMVFHLLRHLGRLSRDEAVCLYTAILTDTGSFNYHCGAATFGVVERLLSAGVDPEMVAQSVYMNRPLRAHRLLMRSMRTFRFDESCRVCRMWVTREMYRMTGTSEEDTEGFIDVLRPISEAEVVFLLKEQAGGVKVSLRSRGRRDVEKLAAEFGGGGHREAAGCFLKGLTVAEADDRLLEAMCKQWTV